MTIDTKNLTEQEGVQIIHYETALSALGTLSQEQVMKAVANYTRGLVNYKERVLESNGVKIRHEKSRS